MSQSLQEGLTADDEEILKLASIGMLLGMVLNCHSKLFSLHGSMVPLGGFDTVSWILSTNESN